MHILVPDELYDSLREKAFHAKLSMSKVIIDLLMHPVSGKFIKQEVPDSIQKEPLVPESLKPKVVTEAVRAYVNSKDSIPFD